MKRFIAAILTLALVLALVPAVGLAKVGHGGHGPKPPKSPDPEITETLTDFEMLEYVFPYQDARAAATTPIAAPTTGAISLLGFGLLALAGTAGVVAVKSKRR